jgi:hypothetical protein
MLSTTTSVNGANIRLTYERWAHITEEHGEIFGMMDIVLQTVNNPDIVLAGKAGEFLAIHEIDTKKYLVVPYREHGNDGFIITAFITRRLQALMKREILWPKLQ